MKSFGNFISEAPHPADEPTQHVDGDMVLANLEDDAVIEKLNAFVGSISGREYIDPEHAVNIMREKLSRVGIHFGDVQFTEEKGEISVPLRKFGGKFGKELDTPYDEFVNETESNRSINFVYERTVGGTHTLFAKIV